MASRTRRTLPALAGALIVATAVFAPSAAQASTIYPPTGSCVVDPTTAQAGATVQFSCDDSTFSASERVTITLTGENGNTGSVGMVRFAISTASGSATSTAAGGLDDVAITLPSDASGTYNIAAVSPSSAGGTAAVTIVNADGSSLPATGVDEATMTGIWIGGGILVLAGATLAVVAGVRRKRDAA